MSSKIRCQHEVRPGVLCASVLLHPSQAFCYYHQKLRATWTWWRGWDGRLKKEKVA